MGESIVGEIVTPQERIAELEDEIANLQGRKGNKQLLSLFQNPGKVQALFSLTPEQARNTKALVAGMGSAAAVKYLGKMFGDELSAIMGAAVSAYVAKRMFG